jgi:hypothetical protein
LCFLKRPYHPAGLCHFSHHFQNHLTRQNSLFERPNTLALPMIKNSSYVKIMARTITENKALM